MTALTANQTRQIAAIHMAASLALVAFGALVGF